MITNKNIGRVLQKVEREVKQHTLPIITLQAQMDRDPFKVLIATKLSLRTKDETTAVASERLFAVADTPEAMLALSEKKIQKLIYPVGFYKTKAKTIKRVCKILLEAYDGVVPDEIDELVTLPGVGRKTANLVLIEGYKKLAMCVDTHVHRISNRWNYVTTKNPDETETALRATLPKKYWIRYNELLVSFGQHRCHPVSPRCSTCPIKQQCPRTNVTVSR
ncbi:MAG: endonuclease III [Candidatus Woesearchaeota archaeon]|nr:endonuclease III [Candidatus Woesearchaeota archaeon]